MTAKTAKLVMKIALIVGILCFFLPFMKLKMWGGTLFDGTGMQVVIGEFTDTEGDKIEEGEDSGLLPNFILAVSLGTAVAACVLVFLAKGETDAKKIKLAAILSIVAVVFLIIAACTCGLYYFIDGDPIMEYDDIFEIEIRPGWIFALVCFIVPSALGLLYKKFSTEDVVLVVCPACGAKGSGKTCAFCGAELSTDGVAPAKVVAKTCPKCGAQVTGEVCEYCGQNIEESAE